MQEAKLDATSATFSYLTKDLQSVRMSPQSGISAWVFKTGWTGKWNTLFRLSNDPV